jgi:hypothetical protein
MKLVAAAAASTRGESRGEESAESTEQIHHPDLGWSPKWERVPTREAFKAAMAKWSDRIECRDEGRFVIVVLDGRAIHMQAVRD